MPNGRRSHAFGFSAIGQATSYTPPGGARGRAPSTTTACSRAHAARPRRHDASRKPDGRLTGATGRRRHGERVRLPGRRRHRPRHRGHARRCPAGAPTERSTTTARSSPARVARRRRRLRDARLRLRRRPRLELDRDRPRAATPSRPRSRATATACVTGFGPFTLTRDGPVGLPTAISDAALDLELGHDAAAARRTRDDDRRRRASATRRRSTRDDVRPADAQDRDRRRHDDARTTTRTRADGELATVARRRATLETTPTTTTATAQPHGAAVRRDLRRPGPAAQPRRHELRLRRAGFLTARGRDTFTYSDAGELLEATVGGTTVTLRLRQRRPARRPHRSGGDRTSTSTATRARPFQVTGVRAPGGQLTTYYYGARRHALRAPARRRRASTSPPTRSARPRVVTDAAGAVVKTLAYDAFGNRPPPTASPAFDLPIGFAGGLEDPRHRARALRPARLRPGVRAAGPRATRSCTRGGLNLYAYVGNDPVGHRDPSGLRRRRLLPGFVEAVGDFFSDGAGGTAAEVVSRSTPTARSSRAPASSRGHGQARDGPGRRRDRRRDRRGARRADGPRAGGGLPQVRPEVDQEDPARSS